MVEQFKQAGFERIQEKGNHLKYRKGEKTVIIPMYKDLKKGLKKALSKLL